MASPKHDKEISTVSEASFDLLFDRMPQSLILSEYDSGKILIINDFFCSTFGYTTKELIGKSTLDIGFWKNSDRNTFINELKTNNSVNGLESMILDVFGKPVWVLLYAKLLIVNNTKTILTMVVDIGKRKQLEKALQLSEDKFKAIFNNIAVPIGIVNTDTTIAEVNNAYCRVSGYSRDEIIGVSWTQAVPSDEMVRLKKYNQQRLLNNPDAPNEYETCLYNKSGERRYVHMSVSKMPKSEQVIVSFIDITQRKTAEFLLEKQSEELKKIVTTKDKDITLNLLHLTNNNQFNQQLSVKLEKIRSHIKLENSLLLDDIDKLIDETASNQKPIDWQLLNDHLKLTRPLFLSNLLSKHPKLTTAEQKLCTLLSLQIGTRQIALITNQQYNSVKVSRTRLRKKLGLKNEISLVAYLIGL